jgi:tetratricopeptide (TPR) repeat protein
LRSIKFLALAALICVSLMACGSPEERAADYLAKAQQLFDEEDYTTARIEAMNAAQIEPRNADVRYLLAEIEEQDQNFRQAVGHLQVAVDADQNHLPSRLKLGNYYILGKAIAEADEQATAAEAIAPEDPQVLLLRARVLYLQQDSAGALAKVETALEIDPTLVEATMFKAGIFVTREDFDAALALVDSALADAEPDEMRQLRQFRIIMLRSAGRNKEVETDLKALISDYPEEESYAVTLAQLYVSEDRGDEAEAILRGLVEAQPGDEDRRIEFARFLATQNGVEAAREALEEFVVELPESGKLKLALARLYEAEGNPTEAYTIYETIEQTEPTSQIGLAARNRMIAIKIRNNELDEAKEMLAGVLEVEPDNADALLVRAAFKFSDRDYDAAIADLRTVLRSNEQSERALLLLARSHVSAGNAELAQDAYRRLVEVQPNHPTASNELADLLARTGDAEGAAEILRRKLELAPDDQRSASNLVEALLLQGDTEAAEEEVRNLMELEDESGLAEFQFGRVMQAKSSSDEAIAAYKRALRKNPEAAQALQSLISSLVENGREAEAVSYLQEHIKENPNQVAPHLLLGAIHAREGRIDEAEAEFETTIELQPNANRAYASLAALHPDDRAKRIEIYKRGTTTNPNDATLAFLLASEYERGGEFEAAIQIYESMLERSPDNDIAANNLAALLLDQRSDADSFERALTLAKRFADAKQPALIDTLGWAYYRNGNYPSAVRYLELATAGAGEIAQLHYHLGMAYLANGSPDSAKDSLQKSVDLAKSEFPGIEEARATLEKLTAGT